jgi:hypothetical protein
MQTKNEAASVLEGLCGRGGNDVGDQSAQERRIGGEDLEGEEEEEKIIAMS